MKYFFDVNKSDSIDLTEAAYNNCHKHFSHSEIMQLLKSSDDVQKQACIINMEQIFTEEEAELLIHNLTDQSTPVREACAFKINQFMNNKDLKKFFQSERIIDVFIKAINDVNPTVARNIIEIIDKIENKKYFQDKLYKKIFVILDELKDFIGIKNYLLNKKTFNLYWCLESIAKISDDIEQDSRLYEILNLSSKFNDYTIREKTAKVLSCLKDYNSDFKEIINTLRKDDNLYVRRYFSQL